MVPKLMAPFATSVPPSHNKPKGAKVRTIPLIASTFAENPLRFADA
jgi:hypothetical protein